MSTVAAVVGLLPLPWPFEREFMQYALVAGLVIGVCAPAGGWTFYHRLDRNPVGIL